MSWRICSAVGISSAKLYARSQKGHTASRLWAGSSINDALVQTLVKKWYGCEKSECSGRCMKLVDRPFNLAPNTRRHEDLFISLESTHVQNGLLLNCSFIFLFGCFSPHFNVFLGCFYLCVHECVCPEISLFACLSVRTGLEAIMETYAFWRPPVRTLTFEDFTNMQKQQSM